MHDEPSVHTYKLDRAGMGRLFGHLEAAIMEVLWRLGDGTVPAVVAELGADVQYNTVQTVMTRLAEKGVLLRQLTSPGGAYLYRPVESRDAFVARVSRDLVSSLLAEFGDAAIAGFLDAIDQIRPDQRAALEDLMRQRREGGA